MVDQDGSILLRAGTVLCREAQRTFLVSHFQPRRGDATGFQQNTRDTGANPVTLEDMQLTIGALLGMRGQIGMGRAMHASRVIGFSQSQTLFVTPPVIDGQPFTPTPGQNVEIVAVTTKAVFWFVCTVEAVCTYPFDYLVLSAPGNIRQLRERKAVRVRTRLAVRHGQDLTGITLDGMGIGCDLSVFGMSLAATAPIGRVGERVCVALQLTTRSVDTEFQAVAVIRNVQAGTAPAALCTHGLEFEGLTSEQQLALKAFVFDKQDAISYWAAQAA
ncbi:flagellar brake protein [Burkholderia sp. SRS-W-2-2016]|uniref:flagellar brake protein n=1 Tax=Burkholderia sp. SRS-W-2-2016 TaxID=1926878 RepID=UPI002116A2DE|nr:flagellar brake protein [Burkholderia sp. SRS-W-2-2016]